MKTIQVSQEVLAEVKAIQDEEIETGQHLCEDKAEVFWINNVEADGALGIMIEEWDGGSGKSHNTTYGWHSSDEIETLYVQFYDDEGNMIEDEYILEVA